VSIIARSKDGAEPMFRMSGVAGLAALLLAEGGNFINRPLYEIPSQDVQAATPERPAADAQSPGDDETRQDG
jgi:hypothetical protein